MPKKNIRPRPARRPGTLILGAIAAAVHELALGQATAVSRPSAPPPREARPADAGDAVQLLLQQGRYWQAHGNRSLAEQAWQKLLAAQPHHPEALYGMAWVQIDAGRPAAAQPFLDDLRSMPAGAPFLARIAQDRALAGKAAQLRSARQLAQAGKVDEAVAAYRAALGTGTPTGAVGMEYYQALGNTLDGWEEARQGLERLAAEAPDDTRVALALAQHLTYSDATRRDGLKRLAAMVDRPDVGREADTSWRKALGWLTNVPSDMPYFRAYLQRHPDDKSVRTILADLERATADGAFQQIEPDPAIEHAQRGLQALQAGQIAGAQKEFETSLRMRPGQARSLGGLGLVRLRQQRFAEAADLLEQARKAGRASDARQWDGALRSARYWAVFQRAEAARKAGDVAQAASLVAEARQIDATEPSADRMLGELNASREAYAEAEAAYRRVLAARPADATALQGLAQALERGGRLREAQAFIDGLSPAQLAAAGDLASLRARLLGATARAELDRGHTESARRTLAQAVQADPNDPWNRLGLARLLLEAGSPAEASAVMNAQPPLPADATPRVLAGVLHARAVFDAERSDWAAARAGLERIPAAERTPPMEALLRSATVREQLAAAADSGARGLSAEAGALRNRAAGVAEGTPELLMAVAIAAAKAGDAEAIVQARTLFAQALAADPSAPSGLQLQYAAALYSAGRDDAAAPELARLAAMDLRPAERQGLEGLRKASAMRRAEALRQGGDPAGAELALAEVWAQYPDDLRLLATQARILSASGRQAEALALYRRALVAEPDDSAILMGAAGAAMALNDAATAEAMLERAVAVAPEDPRVLAAAARYYRGRGRTERAEQLFAAAIAMDARRAAALRARERDRLSDASPEPASPAMPDRVVSVHQGIRVAWSLAQAEAAPESGEPQPVPAPLTPQERTALQNDFNQLRLERSPVVSTGLTVRSRRGEAGMSRLTDIETPVEMRWTRGEARMTVRVTPTALNSGTPDMFSAASRFGSGSLANADLSPGLQRDRGVGVGVAYERDGMQADIGTTPIGFQHVEVVGGGKITRSIDRNWSWSGELSRRAVTDSILSFAGSRDGRSGVEWGGVTATGGRLQIGWDQQTWGLYGFGALHALRGHGVANNTREELGGGLYRHLWQREDNRLTTGLNLSLLSYDRNLRYFTQGQGGYFSPQRFTALSIPLDWSVRGSNIAWRARGSVGVQRFREDATPFFPTDAVAQAVAGNPRYPGQSRHGVAYSASIAMEYRATPRVFVGAHAGADNSRDYRQLAAGVYVRVSFEPSAGPMPFPVEPVRSPYSSF